MTEEIQHRMEWKYSNKMVRKFEFSYSRFPHSQDMKAAISKNNS